MGMWCWRILLKLLHKSCDKGFGADERSPPCRERLQGAPAKRETSESRPLSASYRGVRIGEGKMER